MSGWSEAYNWVSSTVTTGAQYAVNTVSYTVDLAKGALNYTYSAVTNEKAHQIFKDAAWSFVENALPIMLMSYANDYAQQGISSYQEANPEAEMLNDGLTFLAWGVTTVNLAVKVNRFSRKIVKDSVIRLQAPSYSNESASALSDTDSLCKKDSQVCKEYGMRYALCSAISYYVEKAAINGIVFLPYGDYLVPIFQQLHDARFIMEAAMVGTCDGHLEVFNSTGLPVAIAGSRYALRSLVSNGVEYLVGIPSEYTDSALDEISMIYMMGVVAHAPKNIPVAGKVSLPDPVNLICMGSHLGVEIVVTGLTKKLPELLKDNKSVIPWGLVKQGIEFGFYHPGTQKLMHVVLPAEVLSMEAFVKSMGCYWKGVQNQVEQVFKYVRMAESSHLGQLGLNNEQVTKHLLKYKFNIPKFITCLVIFLIKNPDARNKLEHFKIFIAEYNVDRYLPKQEDTITAVTTEQTTAKAVKIKQPKKVADSEAEKELLRLAARDLNAKNSPAMFTDKKAVSQLIHRKGAKGVDNKKVVNQLLGGYEL